MCGFVCVAPDNSHEGMCLRGDGQLLWSAAVVQVRYQLHASAAAVLLPLSQLLHLQPHVLQALLVVAGVLSLPSFGLGALLQLLSQTNHAVPQTQHQHLHVTEVGQNSDEVLRGIKYYPFEAGVHYMAVPQTS